MPALTPAALKAEILADPIALGHAARLVVGDHVGIAAALNRPGRPPFARAYVPRDEFLRLVSPSAFALAGIADATARDGWRIVLDIARATEGVNVGDAPIAALFAQAHAAGLLSDAQFSALTSKAGSRAEELWGEGTVIDHPAVSAALAS
jgi:hypothetical protein